MRERERAHDAGGAWHVTPHVIHHPSKKLRRRLKTMLFFSGTRCSAMASIVFINAIIATEYMDLQSRHHSIFEFFNGIQSWTESDRYYKPAYPCSYSNDSIFKLHHPFLIRAFLEQLPDRVCQSHWPGKSRAAVRRTIGDCCGYDIAPMRNQPGHFAD